MGKEIKKINERLCEIAALRDRFHLDNRVENKDTVTKEREMTHSFVYAPDIIGRDSDKEDIIKQLMTQQLAGADENVSIIPIVGMAGLGKTALAKLVYNDERVDEQFSLKMWVCVSDDFNLKNLVEKIIKSASESVGFAATNGNLEMDQLQKNLRERLGGKKYLLVLDDVWNEDMMKWENLKELLRVGANGSKIMVTTRSKKVASIMGTQTAYNLKGLSHDECLSLFVKYAFEKGQEKQHPKLVRIAHEIVKKCGGVPLAVKTLASQLHLQTDENDWNRVKDSDIWKIEQDIIPALRISYEHLPSYLKRCFAFCSIFPKDHDFTYVELVQFWMAHGLLQSPDKNEDLEDVGIRYMKELWYRSFFQDFEQKAFAIKFKMHDLVHDLSLSVLQSELLVVKSNEPRVSSTVRHLSFFEPDVLDKDPSRFLQGKVERSRTLHLDIDEWEVSRGESFIGTCISRFQCLRALYLTGSGLVMLPRTIGILKHLRFLYVEGNIKIERLPDSICKLQNLQTLFLIIEELEELPRDIRFLISLRALVVSTKQLPNNGIGCLTSLRILVLIKCSNLEYLCEDIQGLINLQTLTIVRCAKLICLPHTVKELTSLQNLVIVDCKNLDLTMTDEKEEDGKDPSKFRLKSLGITGLPKLEVMPHWLLSGSTNTLEFMEIVECDNFMALPECMESLASLQRLAIKECPRLSSLPVGMRHLTTLKDLTIKGCPALAERCKRGVGEDWPNIAHIPRIIIDGIDIRSTDDNEVREQNYL